MATLYEIDAAIMGCIDGETGEIIDPEKLEALTLERDKKLEGVALWVKNLKADVAAYKAEKDAFAEREKQAKAKIESLQKWLTAALDGQKFETAKVKVSFRKSESVDILDQSKIPQDYITIKTEEVPDKVAIKDAIKHNFSVPGAVLTVNSNIQIK